ncbi:MAG: chemotaxis protein CheX [Spirochaetales bacterium]|jgi:chemotaxis protein CheX|nr:chemotaxis protein CheX [Spirochaetales bacterium]
MERYIQPFIDVCKNVFKEFVGAEIKEGRPYFAEKDSANEWDLSAVIGLTGEARGAVVISMKTDLALRVTDILTGSKHNRLDDEVLDAIGEIVNIIAGNAKKGLEEAFHLVISLPTIVQGKEHTVKWPNSQTRIICIPFNLFEKDTFTLLIAIESVKGT